MSYLCFLIIFHIGKYGSHTERGKVRWCNYIKIGLIHHYAYCIQIFRYINWLSKTDNNINYKKFNTNLCHSCVVTYSNNYKVMPHRHPWQRQEVNKSVSHHKYTDWSIIELINRYKSRIYYQISVFRNFN